MRVTHTAIAIGCALALAAGACDSSNTAVRDPSARTKQALDQANIKDVNIDWDKDSRVAHLKGTVESARERDRAEQVAATAVGTSGKVLNELTVTEKHADDMDSQISSDLKDMVARDQVLRDRDVKFSVNNGVVTVKGDVRTADEKATVSGFVKAEPGVKDFANELEIQPKK